MAESKYFVGQVANLLSPSHSTRLDDTDTKKQLTSLFSVDCSAETLKNKTKKEKHQEVIKQPNDRKEKKSPGAKKKKRYEDLETVKKEPASKKEKKQIAEEKLSRTGESKGYSPPEGIVHESLLQQTTTSVTHKSKKRKKDDSDSEDESDLLNTRKKLKHKRDTANDSRTVFVGNVAVTVTKKELKKEFSKYGEIENLRFRCPPTSDPKLPKKLVVIKHDFHPERHNMIAYVCFKTESAAEDAMALNGHLLQGLHLRVDLSSSNTEHNTNRSIFVGNLPFSMEEEDLRSHFRKCGKIENVRIIRDNKTGIGKGFGYVQFKEQSTVSIALMLKSSQLGGREIRVMRCISEQTKGSKKNPAKRRIMEKSLHQKFKRTNSGKFEKKKENKKKSLKVNNEKFRLKKKTNMKGQFHSGTKLKHKKDAKKQSGKLQKSSNRNK